MRQFVNGLKEFDIGLNFAMLDRIFDRLVLTVNVRVLL
jgi:hypothetical protein